MSNEPKTYYNQKGLTVKDLIITGVFSALIFICITAGGGFFAINPVLTFYMPIGSAVLTGPAFLLLIAKVPKRFPVTISGLLLGIFFFATGMHWAFSLGYILMGIAADVVAGTQKYKSKKINVLAYILFSLGATGSYLVYFINPESWISTMLNNGTTQDYINTMQESAGWWVLVIMLVGTVIVAGLSGLVGCHLLKKQFEKAGITA